MQLNGWVRLYSYHGDQGKLAALSTRRTTWVGKTVAQSDDYYIVLILKLSSSSFKVKNLRRNLAKKRKRRGKKKG